MGFLKRFGFERSNSVEQEPEGPIEDVNELIRLAEGNKEVQAILDTYEQNMQYIANNVMMGGGSTTPGDRDLMNSYAVNASNGLRQIGYTVSPEVITQSL